MQYQYKSEISHVSLEILHSIIYSYIWSIPNKYKGKRCGMNANESNDVEEEYYTSLYNNEQKPIT